MDWGNATQSLICVFGTTGLESPAAKHVMLLLHPGHATQNFVIPAELRKLPWRTFVDTAADVPRDVYPNADGPALPDKGELELIHHSARCYVA